MYTEMLFSVIILAGVVSNSNTAPTEAPAPVCESIMAHGGLTPHFGNSVSHRLHSLTLEDLRYYFKADATENNNVPTVNMDLSSAVRILPNAPLYGYDTSFTSMGMRHLDQVLRNMDRVNYGITNHNTLDTIAHTMHMSELWSRAKIHYQALTLLPPSKQQCACVRDIHNNGVLAELELLALKIKYPGITSGKYQSKVGNLSYDISYAIGAPAPLGGKVGNLSYDISYAIGAPAPLGAPAHRARDLKEFDFGGEEEDVVRRVAEDLVDGEKGSDVHLGMKDSWSQWRYGIKAMREYGNYEFAVFIFCAMNPSRD